MRTDYLPYGLHDIKEEDIAEVVKILRGKWLTTGPKVPEFESELCKYIGCKYAAAVSSGTAALDIAVGCLNIRSGEIITTPFTFIADVNAIIYHNLRPVFADIKPDTFNIDPELVKERITNKSKAILFVDYAGQPCDIKALKEIAEDHKLLLIEDAAHALGAKYEGQNTGTISDVTMFSFHPVKHITTGEGGAVTTERKEFFERHCLLRNHGIDKPTSERFGSSASYVYDMKVLGRNYRMTDFQAALGISQLKRIEGNLERRQEMADAYTRQFQHMDGITPPAVKPNIRHSWHMYTPLLGKGIDRDRFFMEMRARNIGVNVHYIPVYKHTFYKKLIKVDEKSLPNTENVFSRIITLPLFPKMTDDDIKDVINSARESMASVARN